MKNIKLLSFVALAATMMLASCVTERKTHNSSKATTSAEEESSVAVTTEEESEETTTEEVTTEEGTTEEDTTEGEITTEGELTSQEQSEGGVPTAEGYYVVVAGVTYVPLTGGQPWSYDPSYVEYSALGVHVEQDQAISFYHVNEQGEGASWNSMAIDPASKGNWVQGESGIVCGETNDYDMYVKMKFEADNIYFGYHAAE